MTRRLLNRQRIAAAATAAVAADGWIGSVRRQHATAALSADPAIQPLLAELASTPRLARRLPNAIGALLEAFSDHPELAPWFRSKQDFFDLCRRVGAVLHGAELARFVDGEDIAILLDDIGPTAWRFGIEHALDPELIDNDGVHVRHFELGRSDLTDVLLAAGLRAVYAHLQSVLPGQLVDIGAALDIDWTEIDHSGKADRDDEAVRRVLATDGATAADIAIGLHANVVDVRTR
jgi:hypothetical protein